MRNFLCLALFVAASFCVSGVAAQESMQVESIVTQQQQIRAEVKAGSGRYKDMSAAKRNELLAKQDGLLAMLEGKQTMDQLPENQKLEVFNTLEWIEATVNNLEAERMVCTHEKTTGSNRLHRVCRTVAQIQQEREQAQQNMMKNSTGGMKIGN